MLSKVAKAHQRGQQKGQRQRHGDESDGHVEEKFCQDAQFQSFANEVVDIKPQKLHVEDEQHDEKREQKRPQKRADNIAIQLFHFRNNVAKV